MRMSMRRMMGMAALAGLLLSNGAQAEVIITEIMYNADGGDAGREWLEIYNNGATAEDIGGWYLFDEDVAISPVPADLTIPTGTMLAPGEALALIEDETVFTDDWGTSPNRLLLTGVGTTLNMANSPSASDDEVLTLSDSGGNVVDVANYLAVAPWPSIGAAETSIYLLPGKLTGADNDEGANWAASVAGTHGAYQANGGRIESASPGFVATVPEPTSLALLAVSTLAMARRRRRVVGA